MVLKTVVCYLISIHALYEEGDCHLEQGYRIRHLFQSTPSTRRATAAKLVFVEPIKISIHALYEEGDLPYRSPVHILSNFNPRPLRGGRHQEVADLYNSICISIHALYEEGDPYACHIFISVSSFQSTPSTRRATYSH